MLGQPFVAPSPCSTCKYAPSREYRSEEINVFEACFTEHRAQQQRQRRRPVAQASSATTTTTTTTSSTSVEAKSDKMDGDTALFDDFLFDFNDEFSPASSNEGGSDSSNNNGGETTPATEISPMSPTKFGELDLDGFTLGAPTFPIDPFAKQQTTATTTATTTTTTNSSTTRSAASDYLSHQPSSRTSDVISPGKISLDHLSDSHQQLFKQEFSQAPSARPVLSIQPLQNQRRVSGSSSEMDEFDPLIDPALASLGGLPSATSQYSPAFSQPPSAFPASAIEPPSAVSPRGSVSSSVLEEQPQKEAKPAPKRKRAKKPAPTSPADAEKQARFLERNRNAASRCRARRKAQNDRLEQRAGELERERDGLRLLQQSLVAEKAELLGRVLHLGCEDNCGGLKGFGHLGAARGANKPPRDLLVSALRELVMSAATGEMDDGEMEGLEIEPAAA